MSQDGFSPGQRLSHRSKLCTVRYVGAVNGKDGIWLGVEWDDPSRGKHAGTFEGKRYFSCLSPSATAASFLRPATAWDAPRSLLIALKEKYAAVPSAVSQIAGDSLVVGGKLVQEMGYDKIGQRQARLDELENVILDGQQLEPSPDDGTLHDVCPNVRHLDIGRNMYSGLDEIVMIVRQLPKLNSLVLDGNRLELFRHPVETIAALEQITSLDLNNMLLTLDELSQICSAFPQVAKLSASSNRLYSGSNCLLPAQLQELTMSDNDFRDLQAVEAMIQSCPRLYKLKLGSNRITSLNYSRRVVKFQSSLTTLDLTSNDIRDWAVVDALPATVPGLQHLQILHNPIYQSISPSGVRYPPGEISMLIIARLPQLQTLNLSRITEKDRLQAETFYLFQIGKELSLAPQEEERDIISRHAQYGALCEDYGPPRVERTGGQLGDPNALSTRLIACNLYSPQDLGKISPTKSAPLCLRLPKSLSIYAVLGEVGRRLNMQPLLFKLIWETGGQELVKTAVRRYGSDDWSSDSDDGQKSVDGQWVAEEVDLVPSTRSLGTVIETKDAWIRIERA